MKFRTSLRRLSSCFCSIVFCLYLATVLPHQTLAQESTPIEESEIEIPQVDLRKPLPTNQSNDVNRDQEKDESKNKEGLDAEAKAKQKRDEEKATQESGWPRVEVQRTFGTLNASHTDLIKNVVFRNNETQLLTCADDGTVCLWDIANYKLLNRFETNLSIVYCMAMTPDEKRFVAAGVGQTIYCFDIETGEIIRQWKQDQDVYSIGMVGDGLSFITGDDTGKMKHWTFKDDQPSKVYRKGSEDITALRIRPDDTGFISGDGDGTVRNWSFGDDQPQSSLEGLKSWTCRLDFSPSGKRIVGCDYDGNFAIWDAKSNKPIWRRKSKLTSELIWIQFTDEDHLLAVDGGNQLIELDATSKTEAGKNINAPENAGFCVDAEGKQIYCGGKLFFTGWDLETAKRIAPNNDLYLSIGAMHALHLDSEFLYLGNGQGAVTAYRKSDGKVVYSKLPDRTKLSPATKKDVKSKKLTGAENIPNSIVRLLPLNDQLIVTTSDAYFIFNKKTGKQEFECGTGKGLLNNIFAVMDDGTMIIDKAATNGLVKINSTNPFERPKKFAETPTTISGSDEDARFDVRAVGDNFLFEGKANSLSVFSTSGKHLRSFRAPENSAFEHIAAANSLFLALDEDAVLWGFTASRIPTSEIDSREFKDLVEQLASRSFQTREQATVRLAGGGQRVLELINDCEPESGEQSYRFSKIRNMIASIGLPDFAKPAKWDHSETVEVFAPSVDGRFWLATVRRDWQSDLLLGTIEGTKFKIRSRTKLRSRAAEVVFDQSTPTEFAIGYVDGSVDLMILNERTEHE